MRNSPYRWLACSVPAALFVLLPAHAGAAEDPGATAIAPAAAEGAAIAAGAIDEATLLLFAIELDQLTLTEALAAYGDPDDPLIPVGELTRLLEMDVEVLPSQRRIVGVVGEARRSVVVDLATGAVRSGSRPIKLAAEDVAVSANDIYLRSSAFERLFPVTFEIDPQNLAVKLMAQELLPIQSRLQRMARLRQLSHNFQTPDETLKAPSPYRLFSMPAFDIQLGVGAQAQSPRYPLRYDLRAGGDLLYGGFQAYVGSDERGRPSTARVLLERRSLEGRLLGPLHARVVSLGDVFTPPLSLGPRSLGGRGISFSTVPLDQTNIFNRVDLRGELPLGYDVELYINDVLRSGQNTPAKGRYEFLNVPLSQGINVIRIVTYGPRGERSEQTRIVNVGGGLLRRGEATFEFGIVEQELPLVKVRRTEPEDQLSRGAGGLRAVANLNYGLTQFLTLSAGAALVPSKEDKSRQIYNLGVRTSLFGLSTQVDLAADNHGGRGAFVGVAGQVLGASLVTRHAEFDGGFIDENGPGFDLSRATRRRSEITGDVSLDLWNRIVPVSARLMRTEYVDEVVDLTGSFRASGTAAAMLFSGGLEYQRTVTPTSGATERLNGFFAGSTFRDFRWQLRATLDYELLPEVVARSLAVTADRDVTELWALRFGLAKPLDDPEGFSVTAGSVHRLNFGDLALTGDYSNTDQSWRLGAQLNFGLDFNPVTRSYRITRPGPGSGGSVLFHAFLDVNGNGLYDPGEEPVPNVTLEGGEKRAVTGPDGRAFVTGLGAGPTGRLLVGLDRIDKPSVQTPPTTVEFAPRPGSTIEIAYPMRPTGEVMVKILLRRPDGELVGLSAVRVRLVSEAGQVIEGATEFDGSAFFESLPLGTYRLELDPEQAARLRMRLVDPVTVEIHGDGGFPPDLEAEVVFEPRSQDQAQETAALE